MPEGWPKKIEESLVWDGKELELHPEKYIKVLTEDEILEVGAASKLIFATLVKIKHDC